MEKWKKILFKLKCSIVKGRKRKKKTERKITQSLETLRCEELQKHKNAENSLTTTKIGSEDYLDKMATVALNPLSEGSVLEKVSSDSNLDFKNLEVDVLAIIDTETLNNWSKILFEENQDEAFDKRVADYEPHSKSPPNPKGDVAIMHCVNSKKEEPSQKTEVNMQTENELCNIKNCDLIQVKLPDKNMHENLSGRRLFSKGFENEFDLAALEDQRNFHVGGFSIIDGNNLFQSIKSIKVSNEEGDILKITSQSNEIKKTIERNCQPKRMSARWSGEDTKKPERGFQSNNCPFFLHDSSREKIVLQKEVSPIFYRLPCEDSLEENKIPSTQQVQMGSLHEEENSRELSSLEEGNSLEFPESESISTHEQSTTTSYEDDRRSLLEIRLHELYSEVTDLKKKIRDEIKKMDEEVLKIRLAIRNSYKINEFYRDNYNMERKRLNYEYENRMVQNYSTQKANKFKAALNFIFTIGQMQEECQSVLKDLMHAMDKLEPLKRIFPTNK